MCSLGAKEVATVDRHDRESGSWVSVDDPAVA